MKVCTKCKMRYPNDASSCFIDGAPLRDLPDPRIGTLVAGRYVIDGLLGEGGMATVYAARHKMTDRPVAVKIMNPLLASDDVVRERFRREAKSAQKLAHPNIIEIFDQGDTEDGTAYIAMERLHGECLSDVIARGPLAIPRAISVMVQLARGIARAHDLGVIHRDLKPENIFIVPRDDGTDVVKILDFGIARSRTDARLTNQGELFGTPQYMAPERIAGKDPGPSSDLYSLGIVYYEILTGELPFQAPDIATFFVKHMSESAPSLRSKNPKVTEELEQLVLAMLEKDTKDRPVDAHRVVRDLMVLAQDLVDEVPRTQPELPVYDGPTTLSPEELEPWTNRLQVFERMLNTAYGERGRAPRELVSAFDGVSEIVNRILSMRQHGLEEQRKLEHIEQRGREGRQLRGHAVDQLGVDLSQAKDEQRAREAALTRISERIEKVIGELAEAQREIMRWEGRCAHAEPASALAEAYRTAALVVDRWSKLRTQERQAQEQVEDSLRSITDLDFQVRELRQALTGHEQRVDTERAACIEALGRIGRETAALEQELLERTSRFTRPLRAMPQLATLFRELETTAQPSAPPQAASA